MAEESTLKNDNIIRPLGEVESRHKVIQRENNFTVVYSIAVSSLEPINVEIMEKTLRCFRGNFPFLRTCIKESGGQEYFAFTETDDLDFSIVEDKPWEDVIHILNDLPWDDVNGPLFRVRLVPNGKTDGGRFRYHVMFCTHHSITDGYSNVFMSNRLMEILDAVVDGQPLDDTNIVEIEAPLEELLPQKDYLWSEMVPTVKRAFNPVTPALAKLGTVYLPSDVIPMSKYIKYEVFDREFVSALLKRCKAEQTTMNAAWNAAIAQAVYNATCDAKIDDGPKSVTCAFPVNIRNFLTRQLPQGGIGPYIIVTSATMPTPRVKTVDQFWEHARTCKTEVDKRCTPDDLIKKELVGVLGDSAALFRKMREQPFHTCDYLFTNMGNVTKTFSGDFKNLDFEAMIRSASTWIYGAPFFMMVVTVGGRMFMSFSYNTNFVTEEQGQTFITDTMRYLKDSILEPTTSLID